MGEGASFAFGPPGPPLQGLGGLLCFGTTEAPAARARGPPSCEDHWGPLRMGEGTSFTLGSPRPPPHGLGGLLNFGTPVRCIEVVMEAVGCRGSSIIRLDHSYELQVAPFALCSPFFIFT